MIPPKTFQTLGLYLDIDDVELPGAQRAGKRARILGKGTYAKVFAARWAPSVDVATVGEEQREQLATPVALKVFYPPRASAENVMFNREVEVFGRLGRAEGIVGFRGAVRVPPTFVCGDCGETFHVESCPDCSAGLDQIYGADLTILGCKGELHHVYDNSREGVAQLCRKRDCGHTGECDVVTFAPTGCIILDRLDEDLARLKVRLQSMPQPAETTPYRGLSERIRLLIQTAEGLAHLHARDVLHGDIAPGNVMVAGLKENGLAGVDARIIDFGQAIELDARHGTVIPEEQGQMDFWPPEVRANASDIIGASLPHSADLRPGDTLSLVFEREHNDICRGDTLLDTKNNASFEVISNVEPGDPVRDCPVRVLQPPNRELTPRDREDLRIKLRRTAHLPADIYSLGCLVAWLGFDLQGDTLMEDLRGLARRYKGAFNEQAVRSYLDREIDLREALKASIKLPAGETTTRVINYLVMIVLKCLARREGAYTQSRADHAAAAAANAAADLRRFERILQVLDSEPELDEAWLQHLNRGRLVELQAALEAATQMLGERKRAIDRVSLAHDKTKAESEAELEKIRAETERIRAEIEKERAQKQEIEASFLAEKQKRQLAESRAEEAQKEADEAEAARKAAEKAAAKGTDQVSAQREAATAAVRDATSEIVTLRNQVQEARVGSQRAERAATSSRRTAMAFGALFAVALVLAAVSTVMMMKGPKVEVTDNTPPNPNPPAPQPEVRSPDLFTVAVAPEAARDMSLAAQPDKGTAASVANPPPVDNAGPARRAQIIGQWGGRSDSLLVVMEDNSSHLVRIGSDRRKLTLEDGPHLRGDVTNLFLDDSERAGRVVAAGGRRVEVWEKGGGSWTLKQPYDVTNAERWITAVAFRGAQSEVVVGLDNGLLQRGATGQPLEDLCSLDGAGRILGILMRPDSKVYAWNRESSTVSGLRPPGGTLHACATESLPTGFEIPADSGIAAFVGLTIPVKFSGGKYAALLPDGVSKLRTRHFTPGRRCEKMWVSPQGKFVLCGYSKGGSKPCGDSLGDHEGPVLRMEMFEFRGSTDEGVESWYIDKGDSGVDTLWCVKDASLFKEAWVNDKGVACAVYADGGETKVQCRTNQAQTSNALELPGH